MAQKDRSRLLTEIAELTRQLDTLEQELTVVDGEDAAPTLVQSREDYERGMASPTVAHGRAGVPRAYHDTAPLQRRIEGTSRGSVPPAGDTDRFEDRYSAGQMLGEGGMGEVRLTMDRRIGRAVAMKIIRKENHAHTKLRARFLFEAKIQGQLEHPSIVPVYDLGTRPDGVEYFTMKRVHGRTLHEVLRALAGSDKATQMAYSRRRLLAAFQAACLAVEFAHQRGVIHRDLKPANLMLGSLGELSILDWGLAKVSRADRSVTPPPEAEAALEAARASQETAVGEILGTPGYMSPEQAAGSPEIDARSDVFALGAMLFEILTLKHLVPGKIGPEISRATLIGAFDARISERFPDLDVPPELEEACVKATRHDKSERTASAMDLHNAIERYLEGDRDVQRRRGLASRHTRAAIAALAELSEAKATDAAKDARARAVREVTRALAIDPENPTALRTMMRLMTEGAGPTTPEAEAAVSRIENASRVKVARRGTFAYLVCALYPFVVAALGVKDWLAVALSSALFLATAVVAFAASRRPELAARRSTAIAIIALSSCGIAVASGMFGPFVYVPCLCAANVVVFAAGVDARSRAVAMTCGVLAIVLPLGAEELGLVAPSWSALGEHIEIASRAVRFPELGTKLVLVLEAIGTILLPAILVGAERDARAKAERQLAIQAQQLAEFVPSDVKPASLRS